MQGGMDMDDCFWPLATPRVRQLWVVRRTPRMAALGCGLQPFATATHWPKAVACKHASPGCQRPNPNDMDRRHFK